MSIQQICIAFYAFLIAFVESYNLSKSKQWLKVVEAGGGTGEAGGGGEGVEGGGRGGAGEKKRKKTALGQ